jgi:hypothetical protein
VQWIAIKVDVTIGHSDKTVNAGTAHRRHAQPLSKHSVLGRWIYIAGRNCNQSDLAIIVCSWKSPRSSTILIVDLYGETWWVSIEMERLRLAELLTGRLVFSEVPVPVWNRGGLANIEIFADEKLGNQYYVRWIGITSRHVSPELSLTDAL